MNLDDDGNGIKIRVAKNGSVLLFDRASGKWIATVKWRPHGELRIRLDEGVERKIVTDGQEPSATGR